MNRASSLRLVVVTLGQRISAEVQRLMEEAHMMDAMALDAAGTVATGQLMRRLVEGVCEDALASGLGTTIRYGPGYTGWELDDLGVLFADLSGREVPVSLTEQLSMRPEKSLVNVVGVVPGGRAAPEIVPCRICDLESCSARREPYRG
jgi:cobalamin-dependent methionine synthase I